MEFWKTEEEWDLCSDCRFKARCAYLRERDRSTITLTCPTYEPSSVSFFEEWLSLIEKECKRRKNS